MLGPNKRDYLTAGWVLQITDFMHDAIFQGVVRAFCPGISEKFHSLVLRDVGPISDDIANTSLISQDRIYRIMIAKMEKGTRSPSLMICLRVADALGVQLGDVLNSVPAKKGARRK